MYADGTTAELGKPPGAPEPVQADTRDLASFYSPLLFSNRFYIVAGTFPLLRLSQNTLHRFG